MRDAITQAITSNVAIGATAGAAAYGGFLSYIGQNAATIGILCTMITTGLVAFQIFFSMWLKWEERRDRKRSRLP